MTRTYNLPEPLANAFEEWRDAVGIKAQESVSAGIWLIMELPGTDRDWAISEMRKALASGQLRSGPSTPSAAESGVAAERVDKAAVLVDVIQRERRRRARRTA